VKSRTDGDTRNLRKEIIAHAFLGDRIVQSDPIVYWLGTEKTSS